MGRKDQGTNRGLSKRGRLALLRAAWTFARGRGTVPPVHALMAPVTFQQVEAEPFRLTPEMEADLERYYQLKLDSMQFVGPTNFNWPFWDGLAALVATFPAMLWLARVVRRPAAGGGAATGAPGGGRHFGFNPLLGSRRQKFALRLLVSRGELARLVAWYGRAPVEIVGENATPETGPCAASHSPPLFCLLLPPRADDSLTEERLQALKAATVSSAWKPPHSPAVAAA